MKPQERVSAILQSRLDTAAKLLLVALSAHLSDDDSSWAWPSAVTLSRLAGLSERHARRILDALQAAGIVERRGQSHRRVVWSALAVEPDTMSGLLLTENRTPCPDCSDIKPDTMSGDPDTMSGQTGHHVRRSDHDPIKEPSRGRSARKRAAGAAAPEPPPLSLTIAGRILEGITGGAASVTVVPKSLRAYFEARAGCDPDTLVDDALLVAQAAREAPGPPWSQIRAEGWRGKQDWSRCVRTILDLSVWDERLAAARAWESRGKRSRLRQGQPESPVLTVRQRVERLVALGLSEARALHHVSCDTDEAAAEALRHGRDRIASGEAMCMT